MVSKRIRKLKKEIVVKIPKFPNDKVTKYNLESKHLTDLLIIYLNWAGRLITPRPRKVTIENEVKKDPRWANISNSFANIEEKIKKGDDLTPYLSLNVQEKGYTPAATTAGPDTDKWADKDFLHTVMGFYHLHLGQISAGARIAERTDDVIFAKVNREQFTAIGIFDHSVFDQIDSISQNLSRERERLWQIFDKYSTQNVPPNSVVVPSVVMTSGHSFSIVRLAQEYTRIINEYEPKLDDRNYINPLYKESGIDPPKNPKLEWCLRGTDLGVFDRGVNLYIVYRYGVN